ncbi:conserved membrane hypothetical protein [uncultured Eubacteriales bacterium]|uniref:ABC-2 type transport system permease protein n=1 Tax=uncultured Eubacteriales bacterium TaxID=172733 RepID=A0A212J6U5_9FIRM|nr:conserved membrane hypothetical protein [uncultured Eubacteriales bacterium]
MRKFKALLVLNLKAMLSSFRFGGKKKALSGVGAAAFLAFLGLYLSGTYSFLLASQLAPLGMVRLVILMMPVLVVGMGLMFTVFAAQGVVFGGRDNDLMLSLPVSAFTLLLSRTLALYLENLLFAVFVMAPAGVAYLAYGGDGGAGFLLTLLLCTALLALLPTTLDLAVGFVLAWLSGRVGKRPLITNLLYSGAFILLLVFLFRLNFSIQNLTLSAAAGIESGFSLWGLPFALLMEATCDGNFLSLILFAALCVLPFLLVVWLFSGRYGRIVTTLGAKSARSDYKLGVLSAAGARRALLMKESRRFFSTPIYFFNAGFGLVLMAVGGPATLVFRSKVEEYLRELGDFAALLPILPLLCAALAFLVTMTAITASSVSLEGKMLWILKEAPIPYEEIVAVKAGFQLLLELPCLLLASVCLTFAFSLGGADCLILFLVNAVLAVFCALFGLFINLSMPKLDAPNDAIVVKQSGAAMLGTFVPMLLVLALSFAWYFIRVPMGELPALLVCALPPAVGSALLLRLLNTRGKKLWLEL